MKLLILKKAQMMMGDSPKGFFFGLIVGAATVFCLVWFGIFSLK